MTAEQANATNSDCADANVSSPPYSDPSEPDTSTGQPGAASQPRGSRLISRLLPPAIRLWLHTQLDHLAGLDFCIVGGDRQILSGYMPQVSLTAQAAVYRGLQVSQATVTASEIHINLGQVLRGKPLRLLQPFPVAGQVRLSQADLRTSLQAPLLAQGLQDVWQRLMQAQPDPLPAQGALPDLATFCQTAEVTDLALEDGQLQLTWCSVSRPDQRLILDTALEIREGRWLCLCQSVVTLCQGQTASTPIILDEVVMDLGPEVNIRYLAVTASGIELDGVVRVIPAA